MNVTSLNHIITEVARFVYRVLSHQNLLYAYVIQGGSSTLNILEPSRTTSSQRHLGQVIRLMNGFVEELGRHDNLCPSSGWFKHIEPSLSTTEVGKVCRVLQHEFGVVQLYQPSSYLHCYRLIRARVKKYFYSTFLPKFFIQCKTVLLISNPQPAEVVGY